MNTELSLQWYAELNLSVERAHAERRLLTVLALKHIRRIAEFPARSAGQKKRFGVVKELVGMK